MCVCVSEFLSVHIQVLAYPMQVALSVSAWFRLFFLFTSVLIKNKCFCSMYVASASRARVCAFEYLYMRVQVHTCAVKLLVSSVVKPLECGIHVCTQFLFSEYSSGGGSEGGQPDADQ